MTPFASIIHHPGLAVHVKRIGACSTFKFVFRSAVFLSRLVLRNSRYDDGGL
jgi:hypothetical protein